MKKHPDFSSHLAQKFSSCLDYREDDKNDKKGGKIQASPKIINLVSLEQERRLTS